MITSAQADKICSLLVDYREAIVELTTAAPENRMAAAYNFAEIDGAVHRLLHSWVGTSAPESGSDGWIEWGGGECPVPESTRVQVRFQDGYAPVIADPQHLRWQTLGPGVTGDIVAYRIARK